MENIYCCESHINMGIEDFINKYETFPIMTEVLYDKCEYCSLNAIYSLSDKIIEAN